MSEFRYVDDKPGCCVLHKSCIPMYKLSIETNHTQKRVMKLFLELKHQTVFRVRWTKLVRTNQALIFTWNLLLNKGLTLGMM